MHFKQLLYLGEPKKEEEVRTDDFEPLPGTEGSLYSLGIDVPVIPELHIALEQFRACVMDDLLPRNPPCALHAFRAEGWDFGNS